jgi:hypothetical protein
MASDPPPRGDPPAQRLRGGLQPGELGLLHPERGREHFLDELILSLALDVRVVEQVLLVQPVEAERHAFPEEPAPRRPRQQTPPHNVHHRRRILICAAPACRSRWGRTHRAAHSGARAHTWLFVGDLECRARPPREDLPLDRARDRCPHDVRRHPRLSHDLQPRAAESAAAGPGSAGAPGRPGSERPAARRAGGVRDAACPISTG